LTKGAYAILSVCLYSATSAIAAIHSQLSSAITLGQSLSRAEERTEGYLLSSTKYELNASHALLKSWLLRDHDGRMYWEMFRQIKRKKREVHHQDQEVVAK
jgi:hypothetical protein